MSRKLNEIDLIKVVEEFPVLYDKDQARGQRNSALKDEAWKSVAEILNISERACVTRWKSLRDRFGKELRRLQEHPKEITNWSLFPHLLFLKDHYKHGCAKDEILDDIKYEPKKKLKPNRNISGYDTQRNTEEDLNPDNILINQQLIELVKKHPVIYDRHKIRDSNHLTVKNEAWTYIAANLNLAEETCWMRWKKLRDRFSREYRYKKLNPHEHCAWIHYNDLEFLEPHYRKGVPLCIENIKRKLKNGEVEVEMEEDLAVSEDSQVETQKDLDFSQITFNAENEFDYVEQVEDQGQENENLFNAIETEDLVALDAEYEAYEETLDNVNIETDNKEEENSMQDLKEFIILPEKKLAENIPETVASSVSEDEKISKLQMLITSMENTLKEAQQTLQAMQNEKAAQRDESNFAHKVDILLSDLPNDKRNFAEQRIIEFLYEMQIQDLNIEQQNKYMATLPT